MRTTKNLDKLINVHNSFIDRIVLLLIFGLSMIPFPYLFVFNFLGNRINLFHIFYFLIIISCIVRLYLTKRFYKPFLLFFFSSIVLLYSSISLLLFPDRIREIVIEIQMILPFWVALLLRSVGTSMLPTTVLYSLSLGSLISATWALYFQHISTDALMEMIVQNEFEVEEAIAGGRLIWSNAVLALFSIISYMYVKDLGPKRSFLLGLSFIISAIGLLNAFNRTLILGWIILYFVLFIKGSVKKYHRGYLRGGLLLIFFGLAILLLVNLDTRISDLLNYRILGLFSESGYQQIYEADVSARFQLYEKYISTFFETFPFGKGLGFPFPDPFFREIYVTDISFVYFLLVYGSIGLLCFLFFIISLFDEIIIAKSDPNFVLSKAVKILVWIFVFISLNLDVFTRNPLVIYIVLLTCSLRNHKLPPPLLP